MKNLARSLVLSVALVSSVAHAAATTDTYRSEIFFEYEAPSCGGELLSCGLLLTDVVHLTDTGRGRTTEHFTTIAQGECIGLETGAKYVINKASSTVRTFETGLEPYVVTIENQGGVISQGSLPDEHFYYRGHATITPNGDLTVNYDHIEIICR